MAAVKVAKVKAASTKAVRPKAARPKDAPPKAKDDDEDGGSVMDKIPGLKQSAIADFDDEFRMEASK